MDMQPFVDAIHSNSPDLPVASIELAGEGMGRRATGVNATPAAPPRIRGLA